MKRVFFFILATMLLAAMPVLAADEAAQAPKPEAADAPAGDSNAKKKADDVSGGRFAGDPVYVHITPLVLPVISDSGVEQIVTVQIDVQVKDFETADVLHTNMPRVMDALMQSLYGGLGQGSLRKGKLVDVAKIKNKAATAVAGVIGADAVRDVLVQGVAQRML